MRYTKMRAIQSDRVQPRIILRRMWSLTALRTNPHFGRFFDRVHPLCWPILWWQLNMLFRRILADRSLDILYSVNAWGFITIRYVAKCEDPATYKAPALTFRPLSDPSWESAMPACLDIEAIADVSFVWSWPKRLEAALAPIPDTS
jgi:hypothetical protein